MNQEEMRARLVAILEELEGFGELTTDDEQSERYEALETESVEIRADIEVLETRDKAREELRLQVEASAVTRIAGSTQPIPGMLPDPFDLSEMRANAPVGEWRARAITALEQVVDVPDSARAEATRKLEDRAHVTDPQGRLPQLILATSNPEYRQAWVKAMAGKEATWTPEQARAVDQVEIMRAAFGVAQSGLAVPAVVDATVILTSAGSTNAVRRVARVETGVANSWKPITSGGVSASFDAELAEVSDDTPTFAQPEINAHKAQAFAQGSIEAVEDWTGIGEELGREFADAKDVLEGNMHIKGTGTNQPFGIEVELNGAGATIEIAPATAEVFAIADVYATIEAVPPRFRRQGGGSSDALTTSFATLAEITTINGMRKFATANNYHAFLTDLTGGQPSQLLGYPLLEASDMDALSDLDPAATEDNFLLISGDWSKYVIYDRIGLSVEFIPHLFATASNLPNGSRGWYAHWRTGAESIVDSAFATMSIPTTA